MELAPADLENVRDYVGGSPDDGTLYAMAVDATYWQDLALRVLRRRRAGVTYGPDDTITGTLAVPPAASVAVGVPVDDTVGTGVVLLSDIAAVTGAQIAAATGA